jgi:probable phosphoglycerate mutase
LEIFLNTKDFTIYLIRHAQSTSNEHGNIIGGIDARLTERGKEEAQALSTFLSRHPLPKRKIVFTSNLPRAIMTSEIIAPGLEVNPQDIVQDARLREIDRGDWEGEYRDRIYIESLIAEMSFLDMDHCAPNGESMSDVAHGCVVG